MMNILLIEDTYLFQRACIIYFMTKDLRKYARQTSTQLLFGGLVLLFIVGDGLIYLIYGPNAAIFGIFCIGAGVVPLILISIVFWIIDWIIKRANKE
jgi:hypothetical protein